MNHFIPRFDPYTMVGLLLTLIMIFTFQGDKILAQPLDIVLIAIPLIVQVFYFWNYFSNCSGCISRSTSYAFIGEDCESSICKV